MFEGFNIQQQQELQREGKIAEEVLKNVFKRKRMYTYVKNKNEEFIIGKLVFSSMTESLKHHLRSLSEYYLILLEESESKDCLRLTNIAISSHDLYVRQQSKIFFEIIQLIREIRSAQLHADSIEQPLILQTIENINFPNLKLLNLFSNNITNVEPLTFIRCPNLVTLNLIGNEITDLTALVKADFRNLKDLFLIHGFENPYPVANQDRVHHSHKNILHSISRWNFDLKDLRLEKYSRNVPVCEDLSILAKTRQPIAFTHICMRDKNRINQKKVRETLKKKANLQTKEEVIFKQVRAEINHEKEYVDVDKMNENEQAIREEWIEFMNMLDLITIDDI